MSTALRVPHRMTVAEFQAWDPPSELSQRRWELVDGEPVCMSPPSVDHAAIQGQLVGMLWSWLAANRPDCRILVTPGVVPRVRADTNERIPDLAVACGPATPARVLDAPLLLVEILSPSNEAKTRANVWAYATLPSVQEILLLSSTSVAAELLRRGPDGDWPTDPILLRDDADLDLRSLGMAIPLRSAYRASSLAA